VEIKRLAQKMQKTLLRTCVESIHEGTQRYYYHISADKSVSGTISEEDMEEIFKICGFYNNKKSAFLWTVFRAWVGASFASTSMEVTS
jgi:predicted transcriptional regulator